MKSRVGITYVLQNISAEPLPSSVQIQTFYSTPILLPLVLAGQAAPRCRAFASMASTSKATHKRRATDTSDPPKKIPKLFPIFTKPAPSQDDNSNFRWEPPLGPAKSCLHAVNLKPEPSPKVAAFDLDGCLIESSFGNGKGKAKSSTSTPFKWWRPTIPKKLKEIHDQGFSIVIVTNQALRGKDAILNWKKKIPYIAAALPDLPFHLFAATAKDGFRKPMPGMWYELDRIFSAQGVQIDKQQSFFVGDAAGRKNDHAATDRKWALNIDLKFLTPEEYFLKLPSAPYTLTGFNPSSIPTNAPLYTPSSTPIINPAIPKPEVVLFVGLPALGKTSFFKRYFEPEGYIHINQDTLGSRDKCIKFVKEALVNGQCCVVDNTNRNVVTRKYYVDLAQRMKASIRCFHFTGSVELAWHNNLYRAYNMPPSSSSAQTKREVLPYTALLNFQSMFEEPGLGEGFSEIKKINWVFEGTEEERARWNMWLQIDGK
ncbi:hypothetical protein ABKN59_005875 [Abortiporus biennis]